MRVAFEVVTTSIHCTSVTLFVRQPDVAARNLDVLFSDISIFP